MFCLVGLFAGKLGWHRVVALIIFCVFGAILESVFCWFGGLVRMMLSFWTGWPASWVTIFLSLCFLESFGNAVGIILFWLESVNG